MKFDHSRYYLPVFLIIVLFAFQSCATTGPGGRKSFILISSSQEVSIGQGLNQELQQSEKWLNDADWQAYFNELGQKIVAVSDRKDIEYKFAVIESDQINAFAAPGGFVYFYTGLIKKMDNEAELAAVMAHEISHVVGRHGVKRLQSVMGLSLVLDLALGKKSDQAKALAGTALGVVMSGYSRSNEHEADDFGLTYMVKAGWHPDGMISMFEKLRAMSNDDNAGFFEMLASSHPQASDRISSTRERIQKLQPLPPNLTLNTQRFIALKSRL
ncbi:MAG: M48 family metallopeptidase [candidate division Zixibacteria bacterium]